MTDAQLECLLDEHPRIMDPEIRQRAKIIARTREHAAQLDARWERIERHAARFVAGAMGISILQDRTSEEVVQSAIALAEFFVDALDRRRAEETRQRVEGDTSTRG